MAPIEDRSDRDDLDMNGATSTLPRSISSTPLEHVPQSNKAATLSKLLRKTKDSEPSTSSSSPLKSLRDKSFPIGKPRLKMLPSVGSESINSTTFLLDHDCENPCETPSYMANAAGNFTLSLDSNEPPKLKPKPIDDNLLPLPPRDRSNMQLNVTQKRHVRKYPLIIPATGIQRTLDKINQVTPVDEKQDVFPVPTSTPPPVPAPTYDDDDDDDVFENLKNDTRISHDFEQNVNSYGIIRHPEKHYTKDFIENNFPASAMRHSLIDLNGHRTYENIEAFHKRFSCHDEGDTASLHFESILENDENVANISDDMVDGFCLFESNGIAKPPITLNEVPVKKPDRKSLVKIPPATVIESKKLEFSQKYPKYKMPRNELASNALFNKIKESVENAAMVDECEVELEVKDECDLKKSINHVSCEDLLDFSENKPKGRERGAESDEVRIMIKMFGNKVSNFESYIHMLRTINDFNFINQVTLERCLSTLDFINWDLQKAIKLCKLQNIHPALSLQQSLEQLEPHWDLNQIANN